MPAADDVIASLNDAADAASNAYDAAVVANPSGDFKELHQAKMKTVDAAAAAIGRALNGDPNVAAAQKALDAVSADINGRLATLKDIQSCVGLLNDLAVLAVEVGRFLV